MFNSSLIAPDNTIKSKTILKRHGRNWNALLLPPETVVGLTGLKKVQNKVRRERHSADNTQRRFKAQGPHLAAMRTAALRFNHVCFIHTYSGIGGKQIRTAGETILRLQTHKHQLQC